MTKGRSRCRACAVKREAQKMRDAPWLKLYNLPQWNKMKWAVHARDGYRCTYVDGRGRCSAHRGTATIEAHHVRKVRDLYFDAHGEWEKFLTLALDPMNLVTLCYRHHLLADRKPGGRVEVPLSAVRGRRRRKPVGKTYSRDKRQSRRR